MPQRARCASGAPREYALPRVYVPNGLSNTVTIIDPRKRRVVSTFRVGRQPELSGQLLKVDGRHERVGGTLRLETGGMAQDIKLFPEGKVFTSQT
jgi:YVTN family beta-propeller protein